VSSTLERRQFRFGAKEHFYPELSESREAVRQSGNTLLKWLEEFQSKESHFAYGILAQNPRRDWRGFAGDDTRRGRGWGGDR